MFLELHNQAHAYELEAFMTSFESMMAAFNRRTDPPFAGAATLATCEANRSQTLCKMWVLWMCLGMRVVGKTTGGDFVSRSGGNLGGGGTLGGSNLYTVRSFAPSDLPFHAHTMHVMQHVCASACACMRIQTYCFSVIALGKLITFRLFIACASAITTSSHTQAGHRHNNFRRVQQCKRD